MLLCIAVAVAIWGPGRGSIPGGQGAPTDREGDAKPPVAAATRPESDAPAAKPEKAAPPVLAKPQAPAGGSVASALPEGKAPATTPQSPVASALPALAAALRPGEGIDLLPVINPLRDSSRGVWRFEGTALVNPRNQKSILRLPVAPPQQYRLTFVAERMSGRSSFDVGLLVGGRSVLLILDGWSGTVSGLSLVNGKRPDLNETLYNGTVFLGSHDVTIVCTVRPGSVEATADGKTVVRWTGPSMFLSPDPMSAPEYQEGLTLGVSSGQFRIRRICLFALTGEPPPVEPPPAAVAASKVRSQPSRRVENTPADPAPEKASKVAQPALPPECLRCVVLIEHPLGSGSGIAIGNGLVVTNAHVVEGAFPEEIRVQTGEENSAAQQIARMLYFNQSRDLCLMEVPTKAPGLKVRGDYVLRAGKTVTLLGNPSVRGGILMRNVVNRGRLSSLVRIEGQDYYQIEATVNPGCSGGPVLDAEHRVIAVVAMKADDKAVAEIRNAMGKLDEGFRSRLGSAEYGAGLTYGIPASALAKVLEDPALHDTERQAEANDTYAAKTITDRLGFLAELTILIFRAAGQTTLIDLGKSQGKKEDLYKRIEGTIPADAPYVATFCLLVERDTDNPDVGAHVAINSLDVTLGKPKP